MSLSNLVEPIKQHYFAHSVVWIGLSKFGTERFVIFDFGFSFYNKKLNLQIRNLPV
ncbi:hypothetical protein LEP1GSC194_3983 [Leptospira alstonii serovar Sichuan str. 79601]|uniref:Uncharacterized protein n=1 Tax=Leptospira alstonii serovar Sichuan str. 79601 TaxID=1218565 RepID=M6CZF4_9LEPT|nr:hypothetical protein LEP1GSC194_3983 [Leptospira alstonii serovar Sichuan str. 79601]